MTALRVIAVAGLGAVFLALAGSACSNKKVVHEVEKFAEKMCACADRACVDQVHADYRAWAQDNVDQKGTKGDQEKVQDALAKLEKCQNEIVDGDGEAADGQVQGEEE